MTTPNDRARAWDLYAAEVIRLELIRSSHALFDTATVADRLLAERDKRFPSAPVEVARDPNWITDTDAYARGVRDERERIANWLDSKAAGNDYIADHEKSPYVGFLEWAIATLRSTPDDGKWEK